MSKLKIEVETIESYSLSVNGLFIGEIVKMNNRYEFAPVQDGAAYSIEILRMVVDVLEAKNNELHQNEKHKGKG